MRCARIFDADLRIDPLLLAILAPAALLGMLDMLVISMLTVLVHELGHAAMAHLLGIRVLEIELMPFGGVARLAGIEHAGGMREFVVALAGPTVNLVSVGVLVSVAQVHPETAEQLSEWIGAGLAIGLFNLLPAFPMDGGRMLRAVLRPLMGHAKATRIAACIGTVTGVLILGAAVAAVCMGNKLNLTLVSVGGFIILSAWREMHGSAFAAIRHTVDKRSRLKDATLPEKRLAANLHTPLRDLVGGFSRSAYHVITVVDDDMDVLGCVGENELVRAMVNGGGSQTLAELIPAAKGGKTLPF